MFFPLHWFLENLELSKGISYGEIFHTQLIQICQSHGKYKQTLFYALIYGSQQAIFVMIH